jgi:hypothetical protein
MGFTKRSKDDVAALLEESILLRREKPRAKHRAKWAIAEEQAAIAELPVEMRLAIGGQIIRE